MVEQKLNYFRDLLLKKRENTQEKIQYHKKRLNENPADFESGNKFAFHIADEGTDQMEREKESMLYSREKESLRNIDSALNRMDVGEYGKCTNCGKEISDKRLEALPDTDLCSECIKKINPSLV